MKITPLLFDKVDEAMSALEAGRCDGYTDDTGSLAGARSSMKKPGDWVVLGEVISKEPLGLLTRKGDEQWTDIVAWVRNALITAEELDITQANVEKLAKESDNPEVRRVLGIEGDFGKMLGLDNDWALQRAQDIRQFRRDLRAPFRGQGARARARREPALEPGRARLLLSVPLRRLPAVGPDDDSATGGLAPPDAREMARNGPRAGRLRGARAAWRLSTPS